MVPAITLIALLSVSGLYPALAGATYRYTIRAAEHVNAKSYDLLLLQSPGRDVDAARAAFARALRLDPRSVRARLNLARLHRDAGRTEAASALIDAARALERRISEHRENNRTRD